jgi:uncharacterized membrane protein
MRQKQKIVYATMAVGGAIGMVASFLETLEYQELLKNLHSVLTCDLNSVFSCSSVLNTWQSKVFGFPNSLMCLIFFTLMFTSGMIGLTGSVLARNLRLAMHGLALFFLGFALWFFWECTYNIGSLCILCIFCLSGLLLVNWGWLRVNAPDLPIGKRSRKILTKAISSGSDIFGWVLLAIVIAFAIIMHFS